MRPHSVSDLHSHYNIPLRTVLRKVRASAHWFLASFLAAVLAAFIFLRYVTPQYAVSASLLLRDDSRGAEFGDAALEDLGVTTVKSSLDNEVEILKSRTLMNEVVDALQLNIRYFASGRLKTAEIYERTPVKIQLLQGSHLGREKHYEFVFLKKDRYKIIDGDAVFEAAFGDTLRLSQTMVIAYKTRFQPSQTDRYFFTIATKDIIVKQYLARLNVSATNKLASLVNLSFKDILPARGEQVLAKLIGIYLETNLTDKQRIADSTIAFIDQNLTTLSSELSRIENQIQHFRQKSRFTDPEDDRHLLLESFAAISEAQQKQVLALKIVEDFEKYLHDYPEHIVPSAYFQFESAFLETARRYNEIQLQRKKLTNSVKDAHPISASLDLQLNSLRADLLAGMVSQRKDLLTRIAHDRKRAQELDRQIGALPGKERTFRAQLREQGIKQDLYFFLLKKRMESSISRSSTFSSARIIDAPKADSSPTFPNRDLVLLLSGFAGIGIPLAIVYIQLIFNDKLETREQVIENCSVPVLAEISLQRTVRHFQGLSADVSAEQFRMLRTNIQFSSQHTECKTILITSGIGGEGKSFIAAHLAASFALTQKKTLLLELDLRKPSLAAFLKLDHHGVTDYLLSDRSIENYIQKLHQPAAFSVLVAGSPLTEAAEYLSSPKIAGLLHTLKDQFDQVIIDTPPIGLVTDARLLSSFADLAIFVVRLNHTRTAQLDDLSAAYQNQHFKSVKMVINGTRPTKGYQYGYTDRNRKSSRINNLLKHILSKTKSQK